MIIIKRTYYLILQILRLFLNFNLIKNDNNMTSCLGGFFFQTFIFGVNETAFLVASKTLIASLQPINSNLGKEIGKTFLVVAFAIILIVYIVAFIIFLIVIIYFYHKGLISGYLAILAVVFMLTLLIVFFVVASYILQNKIFDISNDIANNVFLSIGAISAKIWRNITFLFSCK